MLLNTSFVTTIILVFFIQACTSNSNFSQIEDRIYSLWDMMLRRWVTDTQQFAAK